MTCHYLFTIFGRRLATFNPRRIQVANPFENFFNDWITGIESLCSQFNSFSVLFFAYMKWILFFILLAIGIFTLSKYRNEDYQKRQRIIISFVYFFLAFGFLFNYFTYLLIFILEPLPDRLILGFINFSGYIDPEYLNRMTDLDAAIYPHELTVYFGFAFASFMAIIDIIISVWYMIIIRPVNLKLAISLLIGGVITGIMVGFTTCLPLFL